VYLILRRIRKNLTEPVAKVADHFRNGMQPLEEETAPKWAEALALQQHYDAVATAYHDAQTNAIRLQAALDYAQNAETHRRKMISDITHELKTPLAVIHSYAEGLRDGIAADKQEQYLNVILDEAERMDAMVLQMLDLSRLEAGRVRLVTEPFSLLALTRSILERLQPLADDKQLRIHYVIAEEFSITADKERMEQVITNFATNAIKYTPDGGSIWLKLYRHQGKTYFVLTNECEPLPADALQQVWDSFYRVEEARSAKGTGLGLSIARAIIELHGGTVQAANTSDGVEFQFTLP
jgi:signal transduction histidine kinase